MNSPAKYKKYEKEKSYENLFDEKAFALFVLYYTRNL